MQNYEMLIISALKKPVYDKTQSPWTSWSVQLKCSKKIHKLKVRQVLIFAGEPGVESQTKPMA